MVNFFQEVQSTPPVASMTNWDPAPAFYRFKNCSSYKVKVYWSSPYELVSYNCLAPDEFFDINTYESHIWMFVNVENGNRLCANGCYDFVAIGWKKELRAAMLSGLIDETHRGPFRKVIKITYPLPKLSYLAMETVRDTNISLTGVDKLEIPSTLQSDLRKMILTKRCLKTHEMGCTCFTKLYRLPN